MTRLLELTPSKSTLDRDTVFVDGCQHLTEVREEVVWKW